MARVQEEDQDHRKAQYPLDPNCYEILDEIGKGVSATVYKAICLPMDSSVVAIKAVNLDRSKADFENVRREAKIMSLLSHPNILKAHCSFTVGRHLWVVMPFMSAGSIQSIISASFPDGFSEPCIAVILRETLLAMAYLHDQGHLHRDIKAGNILVDSNGSIRLADFGVSASIYESCNSSQSANSSSSISSLMLTDVAGTPYWMAPEVIHSHTGYSFKADVWSFGITALELAHGRPPLSHLPPSKSLLMKITKRFRFSDYEKSSSNNSKNNKKFSKSFKDMVGACLDQEPCKRPTAEKLLKHAFFKNSKGIDFLIKNFLQGLPSVEQRFKLVKLQRLASFNKTSEDEEENEGFPFGDDNVKQRRISGWNFNVDGFQLEPVFPTEIKTDDNIVKQVRFGGEMIIQENKKGDSTTRSSDDSGGIGGAGGAGSEVMAAKLITNVAAGGGVDKEVVMRSLVVLKKSLDEQRQKVIGMIAMLHGEECNNAEVMSREEQLLQVIEKLQMELENQRKRNSDLEMEVEVLKLQLSGD